MKRFLAENFFLSIIFAEVYYPTKISTKSRKLAKIFGGGKGFLNFFLKIATFLGVMSKNFNFGADSVFMGVIYTNIMFSDF